MKKIKIMLLFLSFVPIFLFAACSEESVESIVSSSPILERELMSDVNVSLNVLNEPTYTYTSPTMQLFNTKSDGYVEYFETTKDYVLKRINDKLATKSFGELTTIEDKETLYGVNDSNWVIKIDNERGINKNKVYGIELNLASHDNDEASLKGFLIVTLIDMFSPERRAEIEESLEIFKTPKERISKQANFVAGNVKYTLITNENTSDRLLISPIA